MRKIWIMAMSLGITASSSMLYASLPGLWNNQETNSLSSPLPSSAPDSEAKVILDKLTNLYRQSNGIKLTFTGSQDGTLWLKADRFYLNCGGVESWFNGQTQWSYVKENEEVTVSNPAPDELQTINPFAMLHAARTQYTAQYKGYTLVKGKRGKNVVLTPRQKGDIAFLAMVVADNGEPLSLSVQQANGETQEFLVTSFRTSENLSDKLFEFPRSQYPQAEIIDMR